jgi:two-component system cell cycle sensor histidine kinase/response regulator CckA
VFSNAPARRTAAQCARLAGFRAGKPAYMKPPGKAGGELTAFLEAQFKSSPDGILVVGRDKQLLLHNQHLLDIFKVPASALEEKNSEDRLRWAADMSTNPEQYIKTVSYLYEHTDEIGHDEIEQKNGMILDRYSSPVIGLDGTYQGRIWSFRDITERKRNEQQLRVQTTAFEAAANAIVIADSTGAIQSVNAAFTALTGYSAREAVGQNPRILKSGVQDAAFYQNLWQAISSGRVWRGVLTNRRKDGALYVEEMTITPVRDAAGGITRYIAIKQDITERKQAELEIQHQAAFLRFNPNPILELSATGDINFFNRAAESLARALGRENPAQILPPNASEMVRDCLASGSPMLRVETRVGPRVLSWSFFPIKFTNSVHCYGGDITERKRSEDALRSSETKFRTLYNSTCDAVMMLDEKGFFDCNPATLAMFGCATLEEFCSKHPADVSPPMQPDGTDSLTLANRQIATAMENGSNHFEWMHKRVNTGAVFPADVLLSAMELDGKRALQATVRDITERKRAEEMLRASQQIIEGIINAIPVRVFWKDKNLDYLGCNAIFARDAGFADPKDIIGKNDFQMSWRDQAEKYRGDDRQVIESGSPKLLIEELQTTPDGNTITLLSSKIPLRNSKGEITGVLGTYMDITERKQIEAYLFQSQKLETVGKVAGGIAHQFNSILTAVIGQSELILCDLPPGNPLRKNAIAIRQAADRAAALTQQLLAYGRKQVLQPEIMDLNQVLAGMDDMLRNVAGSAVELRLAPAPNLNLVRADAGQIEQVIVNMAINACDAMPNGGTLLMETSNVTIHQKNGSPEPDLKPGDYAMLAITDTGAGMSEEAMKHAFEPFFTTKGVGKGTGLGLAACHGIIKQSGGHISISSRPGRGVTFKIFLPQVEPLEDAPIQNFGQNDLPRGTETILFAENDPALREMAASLLRRLGYTVLVSAEGLKKPRDNRDIDLLVTDGVMPHINGKGTTGRAQSLHPRARVLFTLPNTGSPIGDQAVLNRSAARLQKPFTPSALARKVREVLDQPAPPRPAPARKTTGHAQLTDGVNSL